MSSLNLLAGATGLVDDASSLATGVSQLLLVLGKRTLGLDLGRLGLVQVVLDGLLTLVQNADDHRPGEFGKNNPDDNEGNQGRNGILPVWG